MARLLSVSSGFPVLLRLGIIVYLVVGALFPINLIMTREEKPSVPKYSVSGEQLAQKEEETERPSDAGTDVPV
jgi:hypothetical protein